MPRSDLPGSQKIAVTRDPWGLSADLRFGICRGDGSYDVAVPVTLEHRLHGSVVPPFLSLSDECAIELMNELWRCGYRPTEEVGTEGERKALKNHIADLQKLLSIRRINGE